MTKILLMVLNLKARRELLRCIFGDDKLVVRICVFKLEQ